MKLCSSNKILKNKVFSIEDIPCNNMKNMNNNNCKDLKPVRLTKKKKVYGKDFSVLEYEEYEKLNEYNYNVNQLKQICKRYKQKVSGNKEQLINRLYRYLKLSYYAVQIQKLWRGTLYRLYEKNQAHMKKQKGFVNDTDFFTLDEIKDIPYYRLFCFADQKNYVYACDIVSLHHLIITSKNEVANPYNRMIISKDIINRVMNHIRLAKILGYSIDTNIKKINIDSVEEQIAVDIFDLFQEIDNVGNYTESAWFSDLNRAELIRYIRELCDIWQYRAELTQDTKRDIYPPHGKLFYNINIHEISLLSFMDLQKLCLSLMNRLVKSGINQNSRVLGAYYVLAGLTLVNYNAALALPWLYESVAYGN
jgi:hypothetical protein